MRKLSIQLAGAVVAMVVCAGVAWGQAPVLTGGTLPQDDVGTPYPTQTLVTGGTPPYTWNIVSGAPPAWASLNSDGTLTGPAPTAGTSTFTATVTDSSTTPLTSNQATISITINPALQITTTTLPGGTQAVAYSAPLAATGGTGSYTWSLSSVNPLAPWLSVSGSALTATAPLAGIFTVTVQVTDSIETVTSSPLTLVISPPPPPPSVTTTSLPSGEATAPYPGATLAATGGTPPYTFALVSGTLPAGLSASTSGIAPGTLAASATTATGLVFKVTDSASATANSTPLTLTVNPAPVVASTSLPNGDLNVAYSQTLTASGGSSSTYTWSITSGALPPGLSLPTPPTTGQISGTPTSSGTFNFTATATDSVGGSGSQSFTIKINAALTITTSATLPNGEATAPYSQTLAATGGSGSYTWSAASPAPPSWLSINLATGALTGTPTSAGSVSFGVKVTDTAGGSATQTFSLNVVAGPSITTGTTLPQGEVGVLYSVTLAVAGGSGSEFTWSLASGSNPLPPGFSPITAGGTISGTPTAAGPFSFTVQVTDSAGGTATQTFSLTIIAGPTITTAPTLPNGTVSVAYATVTLAATGGTSPYTWSITTGAPPPGINLSGATGSISGTPTASGTFPFTVQVTDAKSVTSTKAFTITVAAGLTIVTAPTLPNGTIGQAYTLTLSAAGGTSPYSWQVTSGALPGGLTLSSSGNISGTPTSNGTFNFTVQVTDSASVTATKAFTLTVASGLTITNAPTLPAGVVGGAYSQALNATGGTAPYTWAITGGALPGGLTFSPSGVISGIPTTGGSFSFTVQVTDSASVTATKSFSLSIAALLAITTQPTLPSGGVGASYTQVLTAVGGTGGYTWSVSAGALPGGLSLSPSSGTISGTPTSVGTFTFTVQVTDTNSNSTTKGFSLAIVSALTITTQPTLPGGAIGVSYSQSVAVVGGTPPYTWSITSGSLPAGLTLAPSSGAIGGTPTSAGSFTFTVQVTDAASVTVNKAFSIAVVAGLTITTAPVLPSDSVGVAYTVTLAAAGGSSPYTWAVSAGGLPGGLTLDAKSGSIFGTPTASGSFSFTVKVTDSASNTATKGFSIAVAAGLTITTAPVLPNGAMSATYAQTLGAVGGASPYTWAITQGALPAGLTLDPSSGSITGAPSVAGAFTFTVQVTDSASAAATKQFSLSISASLSITTPSALPNGSVGVPYSLTLTVAGGTGPYQWAVSAGTPPDGLTLNPATGALSGTPLGAGTFSFTVTVTDAAAHQASQQFSVTIVTGVVIVSSAQLPTGSVGGVYSQTLNAAGGTPPFRWVVTAGTPPPGLTLSPSGVLGGTPAASGTYKFTVQVTDNTGATASLQFTLTIISALTITSPATLPSGISGQPYTALQLAAAGGSLCCTWAITSGTIAPGLSLSPKGVISGTPTSVGTFTFTVQATDNTGATASQAFTITIVPQGLPEVNIPGIPETTTSAQQINFSIALASGYPLPINGTVTLTFAPDAVAPAVDPAIQFSTGGDTANFTIPANTTNAVFSAPQIALQTGTVAGTITLSFTFEAGGTNLLPAPLNRTITIARAAPVISAVKVVTSSNSFQVQVTGYSSPRELTEADLTFTPASGSTLQTTSAIIDLTAVGKQWFSSAQSAQFGSQFILVIPFTASQGSITAVASVSVVLKDSTGASQSASATF